MTHGAEAEILRGERFGFGRNWRRFLAVLNDEGIREAEASLAAMLETPDLTGRSFLDIGSGSGLFSLAARRLGATVVSFDYDPESVACTRELKDRYYSDDVGWTITEGSVLDERFVRGLGQFDIVYSWGVLHHTGEMWRALANASLPVAAGGRLFIAIYNDQGRTSERWRAIKRLYCSGFLGRVLVGSVCIPYYVAAYLASDLLRARNPVARYASPTARGMSTFYDLFDWLGGYPFEVAKPEAVLRFYRDRGFVLENMTTAGGRSGTNQYVLMRP
jgi:2-polyprenyl-3-methyl-5-hydroxy-6-metoxy-1,4-benzoquinol methylase